MAHYIFFENSNTITPVLNYREFLERKCQTQEKCIKKIVTELAVLDVTSEGFKLLERAPGVSVEEIVAKTAGKLIVDGEILEMQFA